MTRQYQSGLSGAFEFDGTGYLKCVALETIYTLTCGVYVCCWESHLICAEGLQGDYRLLKQFAVGVESEFSED